MSFYGLASGSSISSFFGGTSSTSQSSTNLSFLSDYASIRNGSYGKLMKSYYGGSSNSAVSNLVSSSTSTSKDEVKKLTRIQDSAEDLKDAAKELVTVGKNSVFNKVETKNEDGTTTKDYDKDAIYKSVNSFVESYNDLIDKTEDAESNSIVRSMDNITNTTASNAKLLAKIGISIGSDGKMKLDKDSFMSSDMNTVKSVFNGTGSYGYNISAKASMVNANAATEATKANTYGKYGTYNYNYSAGSSYSSFI